MDKEKIKNADIQHFHDVDSFKSYLKKLEVPKWFRVIITHHTVSPTVSSWKGLTSMNAMLNYYVNNKGWDRFPHVFAAPDGIWTMNKLTETGIHANAANSFSIGIEVVGNYDYGLWIDPVKTFAIGAHAALMDWGNIPYSNIEPHRKYNPSKTCPGLRVQIPWVVEQIKLYRATSEAVSNTYEVIVPKDVPAIIREGPSRNYPESGRLQRGDVFIGGDIKQDELNMTIDGANTWVHVKQGTINGRSIDGLGFVHSSVLRRK